MSGFVADPGTDFSHGNEPQIVSRLDALAKQLGVTIYGISGYRSPAHSVAVGGFANDPHTQGAAADIGVNSRTRSSASVLSERELESVGLTRPFGGASEINHVQLGGVSVSGNVGKTSNPLGGLGDVLATNPATLPLAGITGTSAFGGAVGKGVSAVQSGITGAIGDGISSLIGALGINGGAILLTLAFVVGGAALFGLGISRAAGLRHQPQGAS